MRLGWGIPALGAPCSPRHGPRRPSTSGAGTRWLPRTWTHACSRHSIFQGLAALLPISLKKKKYHLCLPKEKPRGQRGAETCREGAEGCGIAAAQLCPAFGLVWLSPARSGCPTNQPTTNRPPNSYCRALWGDAGRDPGSPAGRCAPECPTQAGARGSSGAAARAERRRRPCRCRTTPGASCTPLPSSSP